MKLEKKTIYLYIFAIIKSICFLVARTSHGSLEFVNTWNKDKSIHAIHTSF